MDILGAYYVDALPTGEYVCVIPGSHLQTHLGPVPFPPGETFGLLFLVCTNVGGFKFAGKSHDGDGGYEYTADKQWRFIPPPLSGENPFLYDAHGNLHYELIPSGGSVSSQGYRYVAADGALVSGDATYYDLASNLSEWSEYAGLKIGQGHDGGGCRVWDGATLRTLDGGDCRFIRVHGAGEQVAVCYVKPDRAVITIITLGALRALPTVAAVPAPSAPPPIVAPPPPPPPPSIPVPPVADTPFDLAHVTFLDNPADLASWPATAAITSVTFPGGRICVDHDHRETWPDAPFGDGSTGTCQYTLGLCMQIDGKWYGSAVIQFWEGRELAAGGDESRIALDWYYDKNRWGALAGHQPAQGETVAWFVAAGNLRDNTNIGLRERSDFIVVPFGQEYHAAAPVVVVPPPVIVPDPPVVVVPPVVGVPVVVTPPVQPPAVPVDLSAVLAAIHATSLAEIAKLDEIKVAFEKSVKDLKASLPTLLTTVGGGSVGGLLGGLLGKKS